MRARDLHRGRPGRRRVHGRVAVHHEEARVVVDRHRARCDDPDRRNEVERRPARRRGDAVRRDRDGARTRRQAAADLRIPPTGRSDLRTSGEAERDGTVYRLRGLGKRLEAHRRQCGRSGGCGGDRLPHGGRAEERCALRLDLERPELIRRRDRIGEGPGAFELVAEVNRSRRRPLGLRAAGDRTGRWSSRPTYRRATGRANLAVARSGKPCLTRDGSTSPSPWRSPSPVTLEAVGNLGEGESAPRQHDEGRSTHDRKAEPSHEAPPQEQRPGAVSARPGRASRTNGPPRVFPALTPPAPAPSLPGA